MAATKAHGQRQSRNRWLVLGMFAGVAAMSGLAFASYQTIILAGGGTPKVGIAAPDQSAVLDRNITVRFNTDVSTALDWTFKPVGRSVTFRVGETGNGLFEAINRGGDKSAARAAFNVTPKKAARYFVLTACFCFDQQILAAYEAAEMPVTFFVDPEIANNPNLDDVTTITLSYTFFAKDMPDGLASKPAETLTRLAAAETAKPLRQ